MSGTGRTYGLLRTAAMRCAGDIGAAACCAMLLMLCGCHRRPLVDPDYNTLVSVRINTDGIRNVTAGIYNEDLEVPEIKTGVMHVLFYEAHGGSLAAESFISDRSTDADGHTWISGYLSMVPGDYRVLAYNFGTESTTISGYGSYGSAAAGSAGVSGRILNSYGTKAPGELVVYGPDHLMAARSEAESIPYHDGIHEIRLEATTLVETWYIQIKVDGLEYVSGARAFLSGMMSGRMLASAEGVTEPENTVYFTLRKGEDGGTPVICGLFNTFGRVPDSQNGMKITFDIITKDGGTVTEEFNITELFSSEEALDHNWLLMEQTITIDPPENPGGDGGFLPEVGDWDDENHDIIL